MGLPFDQSARPKGDIAIIGSGAIGRTLAAILSEAGQSVDLFGRDESIRVIEEGALYFKKPGDADFKRTNVNLKSYSEKTTGTYDIIIHTVKAGYLPSVMQNTRHLVELGQTREVFVQGGIQWWFGYAVGNNLGSITDPENIAVLCAPERAITGLIKFGAQIPYDRPSSVILKSNSPITFGQVGYGTIEAERLRDLFVGGPIEASTTNTLTSDLWAKAAGSFAMSSFALITGRTLGGMVNDPAILSRMITSAETIRRAGEALNFQDTTDYNQYLKKIAESKPDHMMSITHDPREHAAIIDMPIAIAKALGFEVHDLEDIAVQSQAAADRILRQNAEPALEFVRL